MASPLNRNHSRRVSWIWYPPPGVKLYRATETWKDHHFDLELPAGYQQEQARS
jgi:hypothetical protein